MGLVSDALGSDPAEDEAVQRYTAYLAADTLASVREQFLTAAAVVCNIPPEPPLAQAARVGAGVARMQGGDAAVLGSRRAEMLDVPPVSLPENLVYHTAFVCPISGEHGPDVAPVALPCGHVISRSAATNMLAAVASRASTAKCPVCPAWFSAAGLQPVVF
eukprot:gnl/Ergobibamus_cyprinoides/481.p2 GENE.gnl/Ergobibamus_cyprinoides/481~~gnl/Ergobibamus_cyprinoides/481.p2  ORF type:complete len:161 (+),score=8.62 gnl/Ergobibamus_cyprinoides/481:760-1242(+)